VCPSLTIGKYMMNSDWGRKVGRERAKTPTDSIRTPA